MRPAPAAATAALLLLAAALAAPAAAARPPAQLAATRSDFAAAARALPVGSRLVVSGLRLAGDATDTVLNLTESSVWAPGAVIVVDGKEQPPPAARYFKVSASLQARLAVAP